MTVPCTAPKANGEPCRASAQPGRAFCRWHDPDPAAKAKHRSESQRGGVAKAYGALNASAPIAAGLPTECDLTTAGGARQLVAVALRRLADLPFDARIAHALSALVGVQVKLVEVSDLEARIGELERATVPQRRARLALEA